MMEWPVPIFLADISEYLPFVGMLIPITALMIPIVAILSQHKQKALQARLDAEVRMSQGNARNQEEIQALRAEVKELREQLHAQVITMDSLISDQSKLLESAAAKERLQARLGAGEEPQ